MSGKLAFDFACNDPDNGYFAGKVWMAQFGDCELETYHGGDFKFTETPEGIRIHRRSFLVLGSKEWFGNWCWNRYWLSPVEGKRLLRTMRANGWRCTCGPTRFYDWMNRAPA